MARDFFNDFFYPRQTALVCSSSPEKMNIAAVEWLMPVSEKPPLVAIALANSSLTLELVTASKEFVVAIPTEKIKEAVLLCGTTSGKFIDKFEETRLTPAKAKKVSAPLLQEAYANLECKVVSYHNIGDHTLVVGEVVEAHRRDDMEDASLLFNWGNKRLFGLKMQ